MSSVSDLDIATKAGLAGAEVVRARYGHIPGAEFKGAVDPVTVADREAEEAIVSLIRRERPSDDLLTEESGALGTGNGRRWVIDPLDGTVNFLHGIPHVGVSVALYENEEPLVAVIVDVFRAEVYRAETGAGGEMNGNRLQVSSPGRLGEALVVTGFPYDRQDHAREYVSVLGAVLEVVQGVRRVGSAALDFAYVAAGRYDAFWEFSLAAWDTAAGLLLVREAGGVVVDAKGAPFRPGGRVVIAGSPATADQVREIVAAHLPEHLR